MVKRKRPAFRAGWRVVHINDSEKNHAFRFPGNQVHTSKYTWWNFVPKNLYEQFRRVSNFYFLIISIIQVSTDLSPTNKFSTIMPLMGVLFLSLLKEGFEDYKRHKADVKVNQMEVEVFRDSEFRKILWKDVRAGDIVCVREGDPIPADLVVLRSSSPDGICYVESSSLDGESNLKLRQAIHTTQGGNSRFLDWNNVKGVVECEHPNNRLYKFSGTVKLEQSDPEPVNNVNVLLRGMSLRNTASVVGLVTYTGSETKVMKNSRDTPSKRSRIDKVVNRAIILVFLTLAVMCTTGAITTVLWSESHQPHKFYLPFLQLDSLSTAAQTWVTALLLFNNLVPISLYVSLEIVKFFQARRIDQDEDMVHQGEYSKARTSNLNEDLGVVEYVFTDKTGTLTENRMDFKGCSIGGKMYGLRPPRGYQGEWGDEDLTANDGTAVEMNNMIGLRTFTNSANVKHLLAPSGNLEEFSDEEDDEADGDSSPTSVHGPHKKLVWHRDSSFKWKDSAMMRDVLGDGPQQEAVHQFWTCLAVCHSVVPEHVTERKESGAASHNGQLSVKSDSASTPALFGAQEVSQDTVPEPTAVRYQAASPDEAALVKAAKSFGWFFVQKRKGELAVSELDKLRKYQVLAENAFTSDRKRMSVLVRCPDGKLRLYMKGADSAVLTLAAQRHFRRASMEYSVGESEIKAAESNAKFLSKLSRTRSHETPDSGTPKLIVFTGLADQKSLDSPTAAKRSSSKEAITPKASASPLLRKVQSRIGARNSSFSRRPHNSLSRIDSSRSINLGQGSYRDEQQILEEHLEEFAKNGLRTLAIAYREVEEAEAEMWLKQYHIAANAVEHREELLAEVAASIEKDMHILGATAIEDKLQDGVPETIAALGEAGMKIWMLTGDKAETATNIGYSCKLLKADMQIIQIDAPDREGCLQELASARATLRSGKNFQWNPERVNENLALVIEGEALSFLLRKDEDHEDKVLHRLPSDSHLSAASYLTGFERGLKPSHSDAEYDIDTAPSDARSVFDEGTDGMYSGDIHHHRSERHLLELAQQCKAVIACRVSPLQKAQIVRLVKHRSVSEPMTLAIGDGGNDVSMIQEAHVGIGISGVEGMQAVRASDFSIAQFRFLQKLLLWHGRNSYRQISLVVLYSFYKNVALVFTLFLYYFFSGHSGTALYESWIAAGWNVGWTFLPVVVAGVTDTDLSLQTVLRFPSCFAASQMETDFRSHKLGRWVLNGVFHAVGAFFLWYAFQTCDSGLSQDGSTSGLLVAGSLLNIWMVLLVNGKLAITQASWKWKHVFVYALSILAWPIFVLVHSHLYEWIDLSSSRQFSGVALPLFRSSFFWLSLFPVCGFLLLPDIAVRQYYRWTAPTENSIIQEWNKGYGDAKNLQLLDENLESQGVITMRKVLAYLRTHGKFRATSNALLPLEPIAVSATKLEGNHNKTRRTLTGGTNSWHKLRFAMAQTTVDGAKIGQPKRNGTRLFSVARTAARTLLSLERFRSRNNTKAANIANVPKFFKPRRPIVSAAEQRKMKSRFHKLVKRIGQLENRVLKDSGIVVQNLPRYHVDIQLPRIRRCLWGFDTRNAKKLERLYHKDFFIPRSIWIARFTLIAAILLTASLMAVEGDSSSMASFVVRLVLLFIGVLLVFATFSKHFKKHFRWILPLCVVAVGLSKTLMVTSSGFFGQTLFQIALFLLVPLQFLEALVISVGDFLVYLVYSAFRLDVPIGSFTVYLFFVIAMAAYSAYALNKAMREQFLQSRALKNEQQRTTLLLDTLMPHHVTQRVRKEGVGKIISFDEPSVTVFFADVIQLPTVSHEEDSSRLVSLMDRIWSLFDAICLKHGVQKIETVGKTYMACAGLQGEVIHHAELCIVMGLDFVRVLRLVGKETKGLQVRVGIHSGPVVSGVVGRKKPQFCLFGNTVNVASRMQSSGRPMEVHVSQATYDLARQYFEWEPVDMTVKSLGTVTTYFVKGLSQKAKETALSLNPPRAFRPLVVGELGGGFGVEVSHTDREQAGSTDTTEQTNRLTSASPQLVKEGYPSLDGRVSTSRRNSSRSGIVAVDVEPLPLIADAPSHGSVQAPTAVRAGSNGSNRVLPVDSTPLRSDTRATRAYGKTPSNDSLSQRKRNFAKLCFPCLYFTHKDVEKRYRKRAHEIALRRFRYSLIALFLFALFRLVQQTISEQGEVEQLELYMQVGVFATCSIAFTLTYFIRLLQHPFLFSNGVLIVFLGIITFIVEAARLSNTIGLDVMFFMLVTSSRTNLSFALTSCLLLLTLIPALFVVVFEDPSSQETYFIIATFVICSLSAFFTEYHSRKNFIELMLTKEETNYANQLAFQMLPATLVKELREGRTGLADNFDGVAILYCDIVGFTMMCGELQAFDVVRMLHQLFSNFDVLTDKHNVFKVQTIGDCYVMAAGIRYEDAHIKAQGLKPFLDRDSAMRASLSDSTAAMKKRKERGSTAKSGPPQAGTTETLTQHSDHSSATDMEEVVESLLSLVPVNSTLERDKLINTFVMLQVARELLEVIKEVKDPRGSGEHINMRVGIHVGNVVGGAIGTNTLRYDIWGSDVHIANLMESNGVPSKIKISDAAHDVLCQVPGLHFTPDNVVEVPSIGRTVQTYLFDSSVEFDARIQAVAGDEAVENLDDQFNSDEP